MAMPTLELLESVARGAPAPPLDPEDRARIVAARAVIDDAVEQGTVVYGVTTGFGQLASVRIPASDAAQLQVNLVRSHAVGAGPPLPADVVRGMMLLLAGSLRRGHSGVRPEVVELLLGMLDRGVVPVIPSKGSVGSSGDLAPLAHLALTLIGEGEAVLGGERLPGEEALERAGLSPIALSAKEGLALINGTHLMAAAGGLAVREADRLIDAAVVAVALSLEAFKGSTVPFDPRLHAVRPQPGQASVAARLRTLLTGSPGRGPTGSPHSRPPCAPGSSCFEWRRPGRRGPPPPRDRRPPRAGGDARARLRDPPLEHLRDPQRPHRRGIRRARRRRLPRRTAHARARRRRDDRRRARRAGELRPRRRRSHPGRGLPAQRAAALPRRAAARRPLRRRTAHRRGWPLRARRPARGARGAERAAAPAARRRPPGARRPARRHGRDRESR